MKMEGSGRVLKSSRILWSAVLVVWILTEYAVMHFQFEKHLHQVSSIGFYYRPRMVTLPLAIGLSTCQRLMKVMNLSGSDHREVLSRGIGSVMLISYVTLLAALLDLS